VAFKDKFKTLTKTPTELDQQRLKDFCGKHTQCSPISEARARQEVSLVGEVAALRIVPRAGSPSLEATITDGSGSVVAVWTGRRRIAGVAPGKRLVVNGRGAPIGPGGRLLYLNPRYELL